MELLSTGGRLFKLECWHRAGLRIQVIVNEPHSWLSVTLDQISPREGRENLCAPDAVWLVELGVLRMDAPPTGDGCAHLRRQRPEAVSSL